MFYWTSADLIGSQLCMCCSLKGQLFLLDFCEVHNVSFGQHSFRLSTKTIRQLALIFYEQSSVMSCQEYVVH